MVLNLGTPPFLVDGFNPGCSMVQVTTGQIQDACAALSLFVKALAMGQDFIFANNVLMP
jgi:hypothetical protein